MQIRSLYTTPALWTFNIQMGLKQEYIYIYIYSCFRPTSMLSVHSNGPKAEVYIYSWFRPISMLNVHKAGVVYKEQICIIDT